MSVNQDKKGHIDDHQLDRPRMATMGSMLGMGITGIFSTAMGPLVLGALVGTAIGLVILSQDKESEED